MFVIDVLNCFNASIVNDTSTNIYLISRLEKLSFM